MSGRDEAITIKVGSYEKIWYRHWCVNHARGNMTTVLRALVQYIIKYKPTWAQVESALYTLKPPSAGDAIAEATARAGRETGNE